MRLIRKIFHDLIMRITPARFKKHALTCEQVSHIIALKTDLTTFKRLKLHMHLFICQKCLDYRDQLDFIDVQCEELKKVSTDQALQEHINNSKDDVIERFRRK